MQTLILVRHSLPEIVEDVSASEWKLSPEGRLRCKGLVQRLAYYKPDQIVSSIEPKARETAELVSAEFGLTVGVFDGLHEHDRKNVRFLSAEEFQESVRDFFDKPDRLVFGNETANQAHLRFCGAIDSILSQFHGQILVVVAHGTVISLFVSRLTGISALSLWKELGLPSFVVLDMQSNSLIAKENIQ